MNTVFTGDFSRSALTDWTEEQRSPDGFRFFAIHGGSLILLDAGNRLLPNIPTLQSFRVDGTFDADWRINEGRFSLVLSFAYDAYRRAGYALEFGTICNGSFARLNDPMGREVGRSEFTRIPTGRGTIDFTLELDAERLSLSIDSIKRFTFEMAVPLRGKIAVERGSFLGQLRLRSFEIRTPDALDTEVIWKDLAIPFAPLNGMDIPITWTVRGTRIGDAATVDVTLSGGEMTRPDIAWFPYHAHFTELLDRPYLRIESPGEPVELGLSDETLILANIDPENPRPILKHFYADGVGNRKPDWPLARRFHLRRIHLNSLFCLGYRSYVNQVNNHLRADHPCETVYDVVNARVVYAGPALPPGSVVIGLLSPENKSITRQIPESIPRYEDAIAFARKNHYFVETEECRFTFELHVRTSPRTGSWRIEYRLEDAFFEPLATYAQAELAAKTDAIAPDIERLSSVTVSLGILPAGIYHIRFAVLDGEATIREAYRAFEVIGETESAAAAAGLPVLFTMMNEVKGNDTDYFDPWRSDVSDVSHYISICASIMPHFARERRFWTLAHLYRREWYLWLGSRVMKDWSIEENRDLIEQCDHLFSEDAVGKANTGLVRLGNRASYYRAVMEILYRFAVANDFRTAEIRKARDAGTYPDRETFDRLVAERFYEWTDYFWEEASKNWFEPFRSQILEINPRARMSWYGPVGIYHDTYKTAHAAHYGGLLGRIEAMEHFWDGYFMLEDYPISAKYSIHSGPFFLATFKLCYPNITVYPEMYNRLGGIRRVGHPDAAVAGEIDLSSQPVESSMKSVYEYLFGCVWHDGQSFRYWRDYGFHTSRWEPAKYEALLRIWGFLRKHPPARPLKSDAFVYDETCFRSHPLYYDEYGNPAGDLFNTAEECLAYGYEMSRVAGRNAGFVIELDRLDALEMEEVDVLVLPPLIGATTTQLETIRRLHKRGIALLCFEAIGGLEDLFGVAEAAPERIHNIRVNTDAPANPLAELSELVEYTDHRACVGRYRTAGAEVLLDAETPVLFLNRTDWGLTALYNTPPTAVRRESHPHRRIGGRASISPLVNESTRKILRHLGRPAVEASEGKIIAFEDLHGERHVILFEDAHPFAGKSIRTTVTITLPGIGPHGISCDRSMIVRAGGKGEVFVDLELEPNGIAIISLSGDTDRSVS